MKYYISRLSYKLNKKLLIYTLVLLVSFFNVKNHSLMSSNRIEEIEKNKLNKDYLKQLPPNDYIIGPGDVLKIIVSRDYPELTSTSSVNGEGLIYLPKLKKVYINNLTISETTDLLNEAYKDFVRFPSLEVNVIKYRPIKVLVEGEVEFPGLKTLTGAETLNKIEPILGSFDSNVNNKIVNQLKNVDRIDNTNLLNYYFPTLFDAIANAGGITEYSNLTNIKVIRKNSISNGGGKIYTTVNFKDFLEKGDNNNNIRIYDSDIIKISKNDYPNELVFSKAVSSNLNPRFITVFVVCRVENPGNITVSKASVLNDAIDFAGGTKTLKGPVKFLRFNNDGTIDKRKFKYRKNQPRGSYKNPVLRSGDMIVVDTSFLNLTSEVISEITNPLINSLSTYALIKSLSD